METIGYLIISLIIITIVGYNPAYNIWEILPHKRQKLILCVIGWITTLILSSIFISVIIPSGTIISGIVSFLSGGANYLFWYFRYNRIIKGIQ